MRERRKAPRYAFGLTGLLHRPGERVGAKVVVRVISTVGCAVEGAASHGVGRKCELYFDWQSVQIGVEAEVVSRDTTGRTGLRFLSLDRDMQSRLNDLCRELRDRAMSVGLPKLQDAAVPLADSATTQEKTSERKTAAPPPPKAEPKRERRKVPRYASELSVSLSSPGTGDSSDVRLITLSVLGGCLEGSKLPEAGQPFELTTEWEGRQLKLQGNVVWKTDGEQVGLTFVITDKEAEKLLRQVCSNLRIQPMSAPPPEP